MQIRRNLRAQFCLLAALLAMPVAASPATSAADHLVSEQITSGPSAGSWPGEQDFTGSIDAGLISAYVQTGVSTYKSAAIAGAGAIQAYRHNNNGDPSVYLGDEAYSFSRLTTITGDNTYAGLAKTFYDNTVSQSANGTAGYISILEGSNARSTAVLYLAYHTLAAYADDVNAIDKTAWRNAVVQELGQVTNANTDTSTDVSPVTAAGAALWALASTGPLDSTLVNPNAAPGSFWAGVKLSDLPALVARQQVPSGPTASSFNSLFDTPGSPGYMEDTAYSVLGLAAAQANNSTLYPYLSNVDAAQAILSAAVDPSGAVHEQLYNTSSPHFNLYNGELLQALPEPASLGILLVGAGGLLRRTTRRRNADRCPLPPL